MKLVNYVIYILCISCVTNDLEFDEKKTTYPYQIHGVSWLIKFHKHRVGFSNMKRMFVKWILRA